MIGPIHILEACIVNKQKQYKRKVRDKKRSFKKSQIIELEQLQNDSKLFRVIWMKIWIKNKKV